MPLLNPENHDAILAAIEDVYAACCDVPGALLTEGDLQCLLFHRLSSVPAFGTPVATQDHHIHASPSHAEVSWFDNVDGGVKVVEKRRFENPAGFSLAGKSYAKFSLRVGPSSDSWPLR